MAAVSGLQVGSSFFPQHLFCKECKDFNPPAMIPGVMSANAHRGDVEFVSRSVAVGNGTSKYLATLNARVPQHCEARWVGMSATTLLLCAGVGAWTALFMGVRLALPHRSHDFCNRLISLVHAVMALMLSMLSVADWRDPLQGIAGEASPSQLHAMGVSLTYFIYDLGCCLVESPVDVVTAAHHLLTILGLVYGYRLRACGTELLACLWLMELSNPCMHLREMLKELGVRDTWLNHVNDLLFVLLFTFARMVVGPYVCLLTLQGTSPFPVKVGAIGIQVVSIFWFYKILRMVYYKFFKKDSDKVSKRE